MADRSFDVLVLGTSFAGLTAALSMKKKGLSVALAYPKDAWDTDPARSEFVGGRSLHPVLKRLGILEKDIQSLGKMDVPFQLIWGKRRMNFFAKEERLDRDLQRECPEYLEEFKTYFSRDLEALEILNFCLNSRTHLPPEGLIKKRQYMKFVKSACKNKLPSHISNEKYWAKLNASEETKHLLQTLMMFATGVRVSKVSPTRWSYFVELIRNNPFHSKMGLLSIKKAMLHRFVRLGGVELPFDQISKCIMKRKRLKGVKLKGAKWEELACETSVIAGNPFGLLGSGVSDSLLQSWSKDMDRDVNSMAIKGFQRFVLLKEAIPVGMAPQGLLFPEEIKSEGEQRRFPRAICYQVHEGEKEDQMELVLSTYFGTKEVLPSDEDIQNLFWKAASTLAPFFEQHLQNQPKPIFTSFNGKANHFHEAYLYDVQGEPELGLQSLSCKTPLKNTFLASKRILAGYGVDGEAITGLHVSDLVREQIAKPKL